MRKIILNTILPLLLFSGFISVCKHSEQEIAKLKEKWDLVDSGKFLTWNQAMDYCKQKQMRLPKVSELKEVYRSGLHKEWPGSTYWSREEEKESYMAIVFSFTSGSTFDTAKDNIKDTRCIK